MNDLRDFGYGLSALPLLLSGKSRSISAENPTGEPGGGARAVPDPGSPASELGVGWKVRPCVSLPAKSLTTLADIRGPGVVTHIWMTVDSKAYENCLLRFYWDGESSPSVEAPLGNFFANGFGLRYNVNSLPVVVNPSGGFNSYWQMPFRRSCRILIENRLGEKVANFFYQIDYELLDVPKEAGYFHARFGRNVTPPDLPEHKIIDGIRGKGHYVGTFLSWVQHSEGWWGEGEMKFYIDDDNEFPTICGTGTEDYFGGAWCFGETFSTPFLGYPLWKRDGERFPKHCMYRWHILDPIRFENSLRVTIQALGWRPDEKFKPLEDEVASVAYWYQQHE